MNLHEALKTRSRDLWVGVVQLAGAAGQVVGDAGVDGDRLDGSQGRDPDGLVGAVGDLGQREEFLQAPHVHHRVGDDGVQAEPGQGDGRLADGPLGGGLDDVLLQPPPPPLAQRENIEEKLQHIWLEHLFSGRRNLGQVDKDRDELLQDVDAGGGTGWMWEEDVDQLGGAHACQGLGDHWREVC